MLNCFLENMDDDYEEERTWGEELADNDVRNNMKEF